MTVTNLAASGVPPVAGSNRGRASGLGVTRSWAGFVLHAEAPERAILSRRQRRSVTRVNAALRHGLRQVVLSTDGTRRRRRRTQAPPRQHSRALEAP